MSELLDQIAARIEVATEGPWKRGWYVGVVQPKSRLMTAHEGYNHCLAEYLTEGDAEFIAHARTDLPRLLAAVRAVEAVHEPIDALNVRINRIQKVCTGCGTDDGNWQVWPCPTIRALAEALGGEG